MALTLDNLKFVLDLQMVIYFNIMRTIKYHSLDVKLIITYIGILSIILLLVNIVNINLGNVNGYS